MVSGGAGWAAAAEHGGPSAFSGIRLRLRRRRRGYTRPWERRSRSRVGLGRPGRCQPAVDCREWLRAGWGLAGLGSGGAAAGFQVSPPPSLGRCRRSGGRAAGRREAGWAMSRAGAGGWWGRRMTEAVSDGRMREARRKDEHCGVPL